MSTDPIHVRCEAPDTGPYCCDGRCLEGRACPQQEACAIRAASVDKAEGDLSPLEKQQMVNVLREARENQAYRDLVMRNARDTRRWSLLALIVGAAGLVLAIVGLLS